MKAILGLVLVGAVVPACSSGGGTEPSNPTAIEIVTAGTQSSAAGLVVSTTPQFIVKDQNGKAMGGVPVTVLVVSVSADGGTLIGAPAQTSAGPTSVGQWTLAQSAGNNELTISSGSLPSVKVTATGVAGAAAKFLARTETTLTGRVAAAVSPAPRAAVTDQFNNLVGAGIAVTVSATTGSSAPASLTTDATGEVSVAAWILGNTRGTYELTFTSGTATLKFTATARSGPPATISVSSGGSQSAPAGTALAQPLQLLLRDSFGNGVDQEAVFFLVTAGGGNLASNTATTDDAGVVTAPAWTLGKTVSTQTIRAGAGNIGIDVGATILANYHIDVRFFGAAMTEEQKALFATAAARIRATVTGDVVDVPVTNLNVSLCSSAMAGIANLTETIDDLIIYASIQNIDGPGNILASAGPCYVRTVSDAFTFPLVGVMRFDSNDLATMTANGTLGAVIAHEMLHVVGIGALWNAKALISVADNTYIGTQARQACVEVGGAGTCALNVPAENTGGSGTANVHWRESVFDSELMTGFAESSPPMPLSVITVGGMGDLGYTINKAAADEYRIPGSLRASASRAGSGSGSSLRDEVLMPIGSVSGSGRVVIFPKR